MKSILHSPQILAPQSRLAKARIVWRTVAVSRIAALGAACFARMPGVVLSAAIAGVAVLLFQWPWIRNLGVSSLVIAIAVGALAGHLLPRSLGARCQLGISFSRKRLLRVAIMLYGLRLSMSDIAGIGISGMAASTLMLTSTYLLAWLVGQRLLSMERDTVVLIGAGSAICGAAAVLATEPVVRARPEQVTVAIATVVLFGTLATLLYPVLYQLNLDWRWLPTSMSGFGLYIGSTIHEVAQVVAVAESIGTAAAESAVIAKMVRVMLLPVFLTLLAAALMRAKKRHHGADATSQDEETASHRFPIPWFAFGFLAVVVLHPMLHQSRELIDFLVAVDTLLLTIAMAAMGLTTRASAFREAGVKPMLLAAILFIWLVVGGAMINRLVGI